MSALKRNELAAMETGKLVRCFDRKDATLEGTRVLFKYVFPASVDAPNARGTHLCGEIEIA